MPPNVCKRDIIMVILRFTLLLGVGLVLALPAMADTIRFSGNTGIVFLTDNQVTSNTYLYGQVTVYDQNNGVKAKLGISATEPLTEVAYGSLGLFHRINIAPGAYVQPMVQVVTGSSTEMALFSVKMIAPVGSTTLSYRTADTVLGSDLAQRLGGDLPEGLNAAWLEQSVDVTPKGAALILNSKLPIPFTVGLDVGWGTGEKALVQGGMGAKLPIVMPGTIDAQAVISSADNRNALIVRYTTPYVGAEYQLQGMVATELRGNYTALRIQGVVSHGPFTAQAGVQQRVIRGKAASPLCSVQMNMRF